MTTAIPSPAEVPTIETARLVLRRWSMDDVDEVARICAMKVIAETTSTIPHPYTREHAETFLRARTAGGNEGTADRTYAFAAEWRGEKGLAGTVGLRVEDAHGMAELGYWVAPERWNRGVATEMSGAAVRFGFEVLGLRRIHAGYYKRNAASGRVLAKLGFVEEGCRRGHVVRFGRVEDLVVTGLMREEWDAGRVC
ncbi:MAG: GNAT family N-acetyltransferase [Phycisphaeraceae bacterium]|nr:GNAT family N-acetyltransferase [Phycisphaeraceae bacterium]